jgi:hypothetical protein
MGKVLTVIGGVVSLLLGVWGIVTWWELFVKGLKAAVPAILILGGLIALFAGISEIKDSIASKKREEEKKKEEKK